MLGFVFGVLCLWGLVRVLRRRPLFGRFGRRRRGCASHGDWRGRHGRDFFVRRLLERLDTSPGQEEQIRKAVDDVAEAAHALKDDLSAARVDLGKAFRSDDLNEEVMAELLTRHDEGIDELRKAFVGSLARIHAALDADQREKLANWLRRGPRWGGPYRSYA